MFTCVSSTFATDVGPLFMCPSKTKSYVAFGDKSRGCVRTCMHNRTRSHKGRTSTNTHNKTVLFYMLANADAGAIHYSGGFGCYQNNTIFLHPIDFYRTYASGIQIALCNHVKVCIVKAKKSLQNINASFFSVSILHFECSKHPPMHFLSRLSPALRIVRVAGAHHSCLETKVDGLVICLLQALVETNNHLPATRTYT